MDPEPSAEFPDSKRRERAGSEINQIMICGVRPGASHATALLEGRRGAIREGRSEGGSGFSLVLIDQRGICAAEVCGFGADDGG